MSLFRDFLSFSRKKKFRPMRMLVNIEMNICLQDTQQTFLTDAVSFIFSLSLKIALIEK